MPKTVRVRIAVAVDRDGRYAAYGSASEPGVHMGEPERVVLDTCEWVEEPMRIVFVEANIPLPEPQTIAGEVVDG